MSNYLRRAEVGGLTWPAVARLDDDQLERRLFPSAPSSRVARPAPDWSAVHRELKRKGVTLQLLWDEYKAANPKGYQYSTFCLRYRRWRDRLDVVMRQDHRAGEKLFVDYAGQTASVIDRRTGEEAPCAVVCGGAGRVQLHLCRGHLVAGLGRLDRRACAGRWSTLARRRRSWCRTI